MPYTVVSLHAHPDDEALLTAGTLARAAAEGHRVVVVTATDGGAGLARTGGSDGAPDLGAVRMSELRAAAEAIGCRDVRHLGYADSGMAGDERNSAPGAFAAADVEEAAGRLAAILDEVGADVLTVYDPAGGYGHPDHLQVHRVGTRAGARAGTPVVLEATVDRRPLMRLLRLARRAGLIRLLGVDPNDWHEDRFATLFADPARITHKVHVRRYTGRKRQALAAHATQTDSDEGVRTLAAMLRLPSPLFGLVFGHEWFVEQGRGPVGAPLDDIFASLRPAWRRTDDRNDER